MKNTIYIFYVIFREISESWTPKQIKKFRNALERTQAKFGEMVGVGKITVFQWE